MKDSVRASRKQVRQRQSQTPESFVYLVRKISEKKMTRGPTTKQASRRARNFILSLSLSQETCLAFSPNETVYSK